MEEFYFMAKSDSLQRLEKELEQINNGFNGIESWDTSLQLMHLAKQNKILIEFILELRRIEKPGV